jgi:hypothetical protein
VQQIYGGGFPVGSGDTDYEKVFGGVIVQCICHLCSVFFVRLVEKAVFNRSVEFVIGDEFFYEGFHCERCKIKV